jgi:hydrogenase nickel incorporation protein HypB
MDKTQFSILEVKTQILENEARAAALLRERLRKKGILFVNLMASPGAGKTTTLVRTIEALGSRYRIGVIEADADGQVDARTIATTGTRVLQVHTGGSCHMDLSMTEKALEELGTDDLDLVFLENVGNLVCPAEFDVGANKRVMILSVPEGDDKPLKYPLMFSVSDCMLIGKIDVAPVFDFDFDACKKRVKALNPDIEIIEVSSLKGDGFDEWINWLTQQIEKSR